MSSAAFIASALILAACIVRLKGQEIDLEHDLGGGSFATAGQIVTDLDGKAIFARKALTDHEAGLFRQLLQADGYYRIRVAGGEGPMTALRARCLAAAGFREQLTVLTARSGSVQALSYTAVGDCSDAALQNLATLPVAFPAETVAALVRPQVVPHPSVIMQAPSGATAKTAQGQPAGARPAGAPVGPGGKAGPGAEAGAKDAPEKPPEEKTWLQKNWIYLLPIFFVLLNRMGQALPDPEGGAARR